MILDDPPGPGPELVLDHAGDPPGPELVLDLAGDPPGPGR